jgi:nucleotide-binding universal stress UspA family protein
MRASNFGERQLAGLDVTRLRTILVATDLSAQDNVAVQRAWQLADAHRAHLKLMYMPASTQDVAADATQRLANLARQLEENGAMRVFTVPVRCHTIEDLVQQSARVDLVVLPHRARSTAAFFRGHPVLRVLRGAGCPVLVARWASHANYQRILVGVDFSAESQSLVQFAAHLQSTANVQVFHAIDTGEEAHLRAADVTHEAMQAYREKSLNRAWESMFAFTDALQTRKTQLLTAIGRGEAGGQIVKKQQQSGADLVVVGKKPSSTWTDFLCGSVAHRVLSWSTGDVLVVPLRRAPRTAVTAFRRIARADIPRAPQPVEVRHERA